MAETSDITPAMRRHFMQKASLPKRQIAEANMFLSQLKEVGTPTEQHVKTGHNLLQTLEEKTELYEFYAAVRAGQEGDHITDEVIEQRVSAIAKQVEPAEKAVEGLRRALDTIT